MSASSPPRRYLSIWLRRLPTDRIERQSGPAPGEHERAPLVVAHMVKSALQVAPSDPAADLRLIEAVADWCDRYTPLVGIDPPTGVMLDVTGCAHLFGGETALARDIVARLAAQGLRARVAIADTPGCAWAVARYGVWANMPVIRGEPKGRSLTSKLAGADSASPHPRGERSRAQRAGEEGRTSTDGFEPPHPAPSASTFPRRGEVKEATSAGVFLVPPGAMREALAPLPLAALRLPPETVAALADVGLHHIADVLDLPRAVLTARFEASFLRRLDQALGGADEPIAPRRPAPSFMAEQHFAEPIARERDVLGTIARLGVRLGYAMEVRGEGARLLEVALFRTDGKVCRIAVGTGAPLREASRISRLFADRLAAIGDARDPGFGYDLVRLSAPLTERCAPVQTDLAADASIEQAAEIGHLIDRLGARFGMRRVTRLAPQDTHIPEFAVAAVSAQAVWIPLSSPVERGREPVRRTVEGAFLQSNAACSLHHARSQAHAGCASLPATQGPPLPFHGGGCNKQDTVAPARPARLFARPERIEAIAEVPDGPPVRFRWRRMLHEVAATEGPERIALEWWRAADGCALTRDYFRIETRAGLRVWLYREGLYGRETTQPRWFLHGLFG